MQVDGVHKRQWLARAFAPYILVGGSETAKREVAFLTGLSLACLFQPFNGEVVHRVNDRLRSHGGSPERHSPGSAADSPVSGAASDEEDEFSPEQLSQLSGCPHVVPKVPPVSLRLCVEYATAAGSGSSTKASSASSGGNLRRLSRAFCVRFLNLEEAEPIPCSDVESLAARSLLLASPSVSELREQMHSGSLGINGAIGSPSAAAAGAPNGAELPWYEEWRRVIFEGSRFSPHETLSQPVGLILVVSTRDVDPVAALESLLQPSNLPQMCRQYVLDPNPVRAVILLDVHPDAYDARMQKRHIGSVGVPHSQASSFEPSCGGVSSAEGPVTDLTGPVKSEDSLLGAVGGSPGHHQNNTRTTEIMERLCAVFPPANCHLLTLGRGCADKRQLQLLPAIRFLYSQSLSFCFHKALSANLTPTLLTHPSPPHANYSAAVTQEDLSAPQFGKQQREQQNQVPLNQLEQQRARSIICSTEKIPVAARLTATTTTSLSPNKPTPPQQQQQHQQQRQQQQHQQQQQQQPQQQPQQQLLTYDDGSGGCFAAACLGCSFCAGLGWQDLQWLGSFVRHFVASCVTPWAEQRIRQLDSSISSNRRGFRNQLRYLWRKPKAAAAAAAATPSAAADAVAGLAAAAEEAGGAAEALLSAVGGALLGDSGSASNDGGAGGSPTETGEGKASSGGAPVSPTASQSPGYVLHAIEWQYRLLGDLSLFFGQPEAALQSYRSCAADFKQDKRWVHLGGAYEMCGVALHATGGPRREVESYIDQAYNAYVKAAMGRLALRCVLLGHRLLMDNANMSSSSASLSSSTPSFLQLPHVLHLPLIIGVGSRSSDASAEVARRLIAANAELPSLDAAVWQQQRQQQQQQLQQQQLQQQQLQQQQPQLQQVQQQQPQQQQLPQQGFSAIQAQSQAIRSAMLLEQAAVCLEQAGPSYWRKRNFQLVMAGHTYYKAGYKRFALRCYLHVFEGYEAGGWHHVAQHLRFIMARQTFSLHLLEESILHFLGLLNGIATLHECRILSGNGGAGLPLIPPERQSHYIREFLFVCRVLLERQRLAAQEKATKSPSLIAESTGPSEVFSDGSGSSLHCVALEQELRVPILQLRDPLGLLRDSIGVYLLGDALLPDRDEVHLPSVPVADLERDAHCPLLDSTSLRDNAGTPSCEALAKLIAPGVSAQAVQELKVQEQFWDCVFSHHLCQLGAVSGAEAKREAGFDRLGFSSYPVVESLRRRTAVGLPVTVELRVVNPLGLRIELTSLRLFGTLIPASVSPDTAATVPGAFKGPPCSDHSEAIAFSSTTIELEPTQSAIVRLMATPLKPGRLCLQGVVGVLFRLVRVCQYFFQHGTHRPERRFNLRYSHFDVEVDDGGSADTAEPEGGPYRLQQRLNLIRQALMSPQTPAAKAQLARLLRGLPLFYALDLEGFRLLHTGTPVEVYRWDCRKRAEQTHKPDLRLELEVAADAVFLDCSFLAWPGPPSRLLAQPSPKDGMPDEDKTEASAEEKSLALEQQPQQQQGEVPVAAGALNKSMQPAVPDCSPEAGVAAAVCPKGGAEEVPASWMLAGEQRECFLFVRNAASSLSLAELTVAIFPNELVSIISASLLTENEAAKLQSSLQQKQSQQYAEGTDRVCEVGGVPLHVISLDSSNRTTRSSNSRNIAIGNSDGLEAVQLFSLVSKTAAAAGTREDEASNSSLPCCNEPCRVLPSRMVACLRLYVRAAYPGLHRVRFCIRGQLLRQQQEQQKTGMSPDHSVWRVVEALLAVAPSLELHVQPRLSWRDPKNFLFLCRVRNVSSRCLQVCGLGALWLSCTQRGREGKQELGDGELDPPLIQVTCDALRGGRGEASSPTILPLVPYRELAAKANCADTPSATPNVLDPNDELLLVFSAQEPDKLKRVVEAGGSRIRVALRWAVSGSEAEHPVDSSPSLFFGKDMEGKMRREGTILAANPISLSMGPQDIPIELSVAPSLSSSRQFLQWKMHEPCICTMSFNVRNTSNSLYLRLRLFADSRPGPLTSKQQTTQRSQAAADALKLCSSLTEVGEVTHADRWGPAESNEGPYPMTLPLTYLRPLCSPRAVVQDDREEITLPQEVLLSDLSYNDGVATRLEEHIVEYNHHGNSIELKSAVSNGGVDATPIDMQPLAGSCGTGRPEQLAQGSGEPASEPEGTGACAATDSQKRQEYTDAIPREHSQQSAVPPFASHAFPFHKPKQPTSPDAVSSASANASGVSPIATPDGCCIWLGKVTQDLGLLPPGESARAEFTALFPCPGIYNMNTVKAQVQLVPDEAARGTSENNRRLGQVSRRSSTQRRFRGTGSAGAALLPNSGWPASGHRTVVTFPFDFLVHVMPSNQS